MGLLRNARFAVLHERAKRGELEPAELAGYREQRDRVVDEMLDVQRATLAAEQRSRGALRVALAVPIELRSGGGLVRASTIDLSDAGFAALLAAPPNPGQDLEVTLHLPVGAPLTAHARVIEVRRMGGGARVGFLFADLDDGEREQLLAAVFEAVLKELTGAR